MPTRRTFWESAFQQNPKKLSTTTADVEGTWTMEEAEEQPIRGKGRDEEGEVDAVSAQVRNLSLDGKLDGTENGSCVDWGPERNVGGWTLGGIVGDGKEGSAWENHLEVVPRVSEGQQEGDGSYKEDLAGSCPYPQRPGLPDCAHYLRTGRCAYGLNCRFNHPLIGTLTQVHSSLCFFPLHVEFSVVILLFCILFEAVSESLNARENFCKITKFIRS